MKRVGGGRGIVRSWDAAAVPRTRLLKTPPSHDGGGSPQTTVSFLIGTSITDNASLCERRVC